MPKVSEMMPDDGDQPIKRFGCCSARLSDFLGLMMFLYGVVFLTRRSFQQYINIRPVRLLKFQSPLRNPRMANFMIVREIMREYSSIVGGKKSMKEHHSKLLFKRLFLLKWGR
jgi:tartrate dehydrogenase/decarboxylase/D-malate dehydrogenase